MKSSTFCILTSAVAILALGVPPTPVGHPAITGLAFATLTPPPIPRTRRRIRRHSFPTHLFPPPPTPRFPMYRPSLQLRLRAPTSPYCRRSPVMLPSRPPQCPRIVLRKARFTW